MSQRKKVLDQFLADFSPLERELGRGVACPVERMVVELQLTPARAKKTEKLEHPTFDGAMSSFRLDRLFAARDDLRRQALRAFQASSCRR